MILLRQNWAQKVPCPSFWDKELTIYDRKTDTHSYLIGLMHILHYTYEIKFRRQYPINHDISLNFTKNFHKSQTKLHGDEKKY